MIFINISFVWKENYETYNRSAMVLFSNKCLYQVTCKKSQTIYIQLIWSILGYLSLSWLFPAVRINYQVSNIEYQVTIIVYQLSSIDYPVLISSKNHQVSIIRYQLLSINFSFPQSVLRNYQCSSIKYQVQSIHYQVSSIKNRGSSINY